jgi:hypothetical protein
MSQPPPPPRAAAQKPLGDEPVEGVPIAPPPPSAGDTYNYNCTFNNYNYYAGSAPAASQRRAAARRAARRRGRAISEGALSVALARLRARRGTSLEGSAERIGESLRRRRAVGLPFRRR